MTAQKMKASRHVTADRLERFVTIALELGYGKTIREKTTPDGITTKLSDTGIITIFGADGTLVTGYTLYPEVLTFLYDGKVPRWLLDKYRKLEKKGMTLTPQERKERKRKRGN